MSVFRKLKRAVRGDISPQTAVLETFRRLTVSIRQRPSRNRPPVAQLTPHFARLSPQDLLRHFRLRKTPIAFPALQSPTFGERQRELFPAATVELLESANRIVALRRWRLSGLGEREFGKHIEWRRDPLSDYEWPLKPHRTIQLIRSDGSDVRLVWELNRMGHLLTLARAYQLTNDESIANEFFGQLRSWSADNPYGAGPNWTCAMEVALRATNLLAAFEVFKKSSQLDESSLALFVDVVNQHGNYIRRNLEFSYIATSNHYLSDVAGLLWIGTLLPELRGANEWRAFGFRELLREMDKQVLNDGADFESSTGYHRFVLEVFLSSFLLCRANGIEIEERYWKKLESMFAYVAAYVRPDGGAPLLGDSDGGQFLPLKQHAADDHAYLLPIGAALYGNELFKTGNGSASEELLWYLGDDGVSKYGQLRVSVPSSADFSDAGVYFLRHKDLYLCFNASGPGLNGRGSHGHNDALSVEISAGKRVFVIDPGTFVYSADLAARHLFRSTSYHSTVEIDSIDQNATSPEMPFVIGREATPHIVAWETGPEVDKVSAIHYGYGRLPSPVHHRRTVTFNKHEEWWLIEDELITEGEHQFKIRFHFDAGLEVAVSENSVRATDRAKRVSLTVRSLAATDGPTLEKQAVSRDYGQKESSIAATWTVQGRNSKLAWRVDVRREV